MARLKEILFRLPREAGALHGASHRRLVHDPVEYTRSRVMNPGTDDRWRHTDIEPVATTPALPSLPSCAGINAVPAV